MAAWDYIEWYNRQPIWLEVLLFPIIVPVMFVHGTIMMAFFLFAFLPFVLIKGSIEHRRFWKKLRERGQVTRWPEVEPQVRSGSGTLVVEVTPKGAGWSWFIAHTRDEVDPQHVVPSWQDFEQREWELFESKEGFTSLNRWSVERLGAYESSARALFVSGETLARLETEVKQRSILAVLGACEGCLTKRCR